MMKGTMKRKQNYDECIESTHIKFEDDDDKGKKPRRGDQKKGFGGKKFNKPKRYSK